MNHKSIARSVSVITALALVPASYLRGATKEQVELETEGTRLIQQVKDVARSTKYNAEQLASFLRAGQVSKWSHRHHLHEIKVLINEGLQPALKRLTEIQPQLPEWKQQSIDKMMESAAALADDASSTIITQNEAGEVPSVLNTQYKDLVSKMINHAETLVKTSDAASAYAEARLKADAAGLNLAKQ
jgi:hypothetical protein